jgi:tetratricopeptide (TPR) repeat protein
LFMGQLWRLVVFILVVGGILFHPLQRALERNLMYLALVPLTLDLKPGGTCGYAILTDSDAQRAAWAKQIDALRSVTSLEGDASAREANVQGLVALGRAEEAETAGGSDPAPVSVLRLAMLKLSEGDAERSAAELERVFPNTFERAMARGQALLYGEEFGEALSCFELGTALDDSKPEGHLARGRLLARMDNPTGALRAFERAIELCPTCAEAYLGRGSARLVSGSGTRVEVEADFLRAVELAPDDYEAVMQWGYWLRDNGKREQAAAQFRHAIDLYSGAIEPFEALVSYYCAMHDAENLAWLETKMESSGLSEEQIEQLKLSKMRCE